MKKRSTKALKITIIFIAAMLSILISGFYIYTLDYYKADDVVQTYTTDTSSVQSQGNIMVLYSNKQKDKGTGLIFYPGGKVEAIAYLPLLEELSQKGITCVLVKMPFNLAVFNINGADRVYSKLPDIESWYIAGHSLGGAMASSYAEKNSDKLKGLVLLGAYAINDADIPTIAVYGSEDKVIDKTKLETTVNKFEIVGGNHAYFGNYGEQKGDGTAYITREEQQKETVKAIIKFMQLEETI